MKNETKHPKNKKHQERSVGRERGLVGGSVKDELP